MKIAFIVVSFVSHIFGVHAFIVPEEVPSILSIIYSNIPVLKKGTDSRVGWGFRLGNHADFQTVVELGPQIYTQRLANQDDGGTNKRNTINSLSNILYAQRQKGEISDTEGGKWLDNWSKMVQENTDDVALKARPGLAIGEIDAKSVIPDDSALKLQDLYRG